MNRGLIGGMFCILALAVALPVSAAIFQTGDEFSLSEGETLFEDLYAFGGSIVTEGDIQGDMIVMGGKVLSSGFVSGDIVAVGGNIDILNSVGDDVRVVAGQVVISKSVQGDVLVAGGQVHILPDAIIQGDVIGVGGRVVIEGAVRGDARLYGGDIVVNGSVGGNLDVFADNRFSLGEGASIGGNLMYRAPEELQILDTVVQGETTFELHSVRFDQSLISAVLGAAFLLKVLMLLVVGLLAVVFFGQFSQDLGNYVVPHFGKSLLVGFVLFVVVPAFIFLLLISVIGIAVGLVLMLIYALALTIAKVYAGILAGALLSRWIKKGVIVDWRWTIIGIVLLQLISLVPVVGWAAGTLMMLAALGGLAHFAHQRFWISR
jgi:hypothetical protein